MIEDEFETAVLAVLRRASGSADDPITDSAVDLYLNRFGNDQGARMMALKRLTTALLALDADEEAELSERRVAER